jgi:hypothetical protein
MRPVVVVVTDVLIHEALQMSFVENYHMVEQILAAVANLACFSTPRICSTENRCFFIGNFLSPRGCGHGRRLTFTVVQTTGTSPPKINRTPVITQ